MWKEEIRNNAKFADDTFLYNFYERGVYEKDSYSKLNQAISGYKFYKFQDPIIDDNILFIFTKILEKVTLHEDPNDCYFIKNMPESFREKILLFKLVASAN